MNIVKSLAAAAGFVLCLAHAAFAADANPLIGQWIDKLPSGNAMVIEFSAKEISFQSMTADGGALPPSTFGASYQDEGGGKYTVAIEGQPGNPMAVTLGGGDKLSLQFPNMEPRNLVRYTPPLTAKPPGHP